MLNGLRDFTVKMVAGANVATVAFMLLVGYSDLLNPERFPAFCNAGLLFPVFLSLNLGFLYSGSSSVPGMFSFHCWAFWSASYLSASICRSI